MNMSISRRLGLSLLAAFCLAAVFSSSAMAAGKPTEVKSGFNFAITKVNKIGMSGWANPNGASTTVTFEYKKPTESTYKVLATQAIGSGTTQVKVTANGVAPPGTEYDIRISATNSFGTTTGSSGFFYSDWDIVLGTKPFTIGSEGTWTLAWKQVGTEYKIQCDENSSGTLGNAEALGDSFHVSTSGCGYYANNVKQCSLSPISYTLNNVFETAPLYVTLCGAEFESKITLPGAMEVGMPLESYTVSKAVTLTDNGSFNGSAATLTQNSTWFATGANVGKKFGFSVE